MPPLAPDFQESVRKALGAEGVSPQRASEVAAATERLLYASAMRKVADKLEKEARAALRKAGLKKKDLDLLLKRTSTWAKRPRKKK